MTQAEAIMAVLKRAGRPLQRGELLDQVQELGYGWHRNSLASTTEILRRKRGLLAHPPEGGWVLTEAAQRLELPVLPPQGAAAEPEAGDEPEDEYDEDYLEAEVGEVVEPPRARRPVVTVSSFDRVKNLEIAVKTLEAKVCHALENQQPRLGIVRQGRRWLFDVLTGLAEKVRG